MYGNQEVGRRFNAMLEMGRSHPWPDALEAFTGTRQMDGSSMVHYFQPLMAWLGPCIGQAAFEVGAEVREAFVAHDARAAQHFMAGAQPGKYQADLAALARQRLRRAGITAIYGNDSSVQWCTASVPSRFFSHRRDSARLGRTGRMAASIWLG